MPDPGARRRSKGSARTRRLRTVMASKCMERVLCASLFFLYLSAEWSR